MSTRKVCPQKDWFNHKSIKLSNNDQFNAFIEGGYSTYGLKAGVKNLSGMLPTYYFHCKKCEGYVQEDAGPTGQGQYLQRPLPEEEEIGHFIRY